MTRDRSVSHYWARQVAGWVVMFGLLGAWYLTLAPAVVGGSATFVMVQGHSMEPMLYTGDLVVARSQDHYQKGDMVVFAVARGHVIHQLHSGTEASGWLTKGINNDWIDPWTIPNSDIAGKYWFSIPGFSQKLQFPRQNPLIFGLVCGAVTLLSLVPRRRRRITEELADALSRATPETSSARLKSTEGLIFGIAVVALILSFLGLSNVLASKMLITWQGGIVVAALVFSGALAAFFGYRQFDGRGLAEPTRSLRPFSGRLYHVAEFPELPEGTPIVAVKSVDELALIAEKYRLPVLHADDPETGRHGLLVITAKRGAYYWEVTAHHAREVAASSTTPDGSGVVHH